MRSDGSEKSPASKAAVSGFYWNGEHLSGSGRSA